MLGILIFASTRVLSTREFQLNMNYGSSLPPWFSALDNHKYALSVHVPIWYGVAFTVYSMRIRSEQSLVEGWRNPVSVYLSVFSKCKNTVVQRKDYRIWNYIISLAERCFGTTATMDSATPWIMCKAMNRFSFMPMDIAYDQNERVKW